MKPMVKTFLAQKISFIFNPLILINLGIETLLWHHFRQGFLKSWQLAILSVIFVFIPLVFFFHSARKNKFDFDMSRKEARFRYFVFSLACGFLGLNLAYYFSQNLFRIFLALTITALTFAVVTFREKVSIHTGGATWFYLVLNLFCQWRWFFLFPLIPLIGWSGIVLGKHKRVQVLEGFLIPLITVPVGFFLLKIP